MQQRSRATVALVALSLSTFTYVTTETLPIGLLSLIADDLRSSPAAVGLLVTGYGLVVVVASIPLTRLSERLPRRWLLTGLLSILTVTTCASALATSYEVLLAARMLTALSQALFWSVVTPTAAALFSPAVRGKAVSVLFAGSSLAGVLGVPAGTWLGQLAGWRAAFLALAGLGLLLVAVVAVALPSTSAGDDEAQRATAPDAGRYWSLMVTITLVVTGAFAAFTYVSPFLTEVSGFSADAVSPVLLIRGAAGLLGVVMVGFLIDRGAQHTKTHGAWLTMLVVVAVQVVSLAGQYLAGDVQIVAVMAVAGSGLALAGMATALGTRILQVAPGRADLASAGSSTAFNVGITAGALLGSLLLQYAGPRSTPLVGAGLTLAGLATLLAEPALSTVRRRAVADFRGGVGSRPVQRKSATVH